MISNKDPTGIKTVCCVCNKTIKEGKTKNGCVSHGYCKVCLGKAFKELRKSKKEKKKMRSSKCDGCQVPDEMCEPRVCAMHDQKEQKKEKIMNNNWTIIYNGTSMYGKHPLSIAEDGDSLVAIVAESSDAEKRANLLVAAPKLLAALEKVYSSNHMMIGCFAEHEDEIVSALATAYGISEQEIIDK